MLMDSQHEIRGADEFFFAPARQQRTAGAAAVFCQSKWGATLEESSLEHQMYEIHPSKRRILRLLADANKECQEGGRLTC